MGLKKQLENDVETQERVVGRNVEVPEKTWRGLYIEILQCGGQNKCKGCRNMQERVVETTGAKSNLLTVDAVIISIFGNYYEKESNYFHQKSLLHQCVKTLHYIDWIRTIFVRVNSGSHNNISMKKVFTGFLDICLW